MSQGIKKEWMMVLGTAAAAAWLLRKPRAAAAFSGAAGLLYWASRAERESFRHKSVLITGGSRGLGLALAMEFAREGARVAILARDREELLRARALIEKAVPEASVRAYICDLTDYRKFARAIKLVVLDQGGLDVLVNNAGAITVGPFDSMDMEDFRAQMELHFFAVVNACKLALPYLRERPGGRIVNISSMGGKVGVPHMLPYDSSKFALGGFSQGLMAELAAEGISVTAVYPTVMRTGSPIQAVFKGDQEKEFAWFAATDVMPGLSLDAEAAAKKIVEAARSRVSELVPSYPARARNALAALLPETFSWMMARLAAALPGGYSHQHKTGADSQGIFGKNLWAWPLRRRARAAEKRWNQEPQHDGRRAMGL